MEFLVYYQKQTSKFFYEFGLCINEFNKFLALPPGIEVEFKDQYSNQKENC